MGFDPDLLPWYHGLEYFDTRSWVTANGRPFVHYTAGNLAEALEDWLSHESVTA